ncbi:hypothetical protein, partial [Rhodoblastus sp.]|uniref:hypothetical protein n=1 Tax=Rhodoblastus sp. TaxID=1962975 RepID=UPI003F961CE7
KTGQTAQHRLTGAFEAAHLVKSRKAQQARAKGSRRKQEKKKDQNGDEGLGEIEAKEIHRDTGVLRRLSLCEIHCQMIDWPTVAGGNASRVSKS